MPYLTSTGTRRPGAVGWRLGFGVPGCAHPLVAPAEWAELARPRTPLHWAVLNVARGPGSRPDPHCLGAAARLHEARARVLGHLDLRFGTRPFGELISDAHRFLEWYQVNGFYLDRCPTERPGLAEVRRLATTLRALCAPVYVVFGHGTHPYPDYVQDADQLVTFCGQWADYRWSQAAPWTADYPPERFCHLVHGVPRTHLDEALRIARWQGAGTIYFTDRQGHGQSDAWETLPGYWDEIVSRIGPGVTE
ncbi:spherulation-specific family 4 protein [Streptomyces sp. 796.1]|uniref:spherulation-specific family 4 protein n=1 Tax=Streptomyces sp. 796.1 TaxID=3163029 RepID=UPI0039C9BC79